VRKETRRQKMDKYLVIYVYDNGTAEYFFYDDDKKAIERALFELSGASITHAFVLNLNTQKEVWNSAEKDCSHPSAKVAWKCVCRETRDQPAEFTGWAVCEKCGESFDVEDLPSWAKIID
jgi:hypothetical protein